VIVSIRSSLTFVVVALLLAFCVLLFGRETISGFAIWRWTSTPNAKWNPPCFELKVLAFNLNAVHQLHSLFGVEWESNTANFIYALHLWVKIMSYRNIGVLLLENLSIGFQEAILVLRHFQWRLTWSLHARQFNSIFGVELASKTPTCVEISAWHWGVRQIAFTFTPPLFTESAPFFALTWTQHVYCVEFCAMYPGVQLNTSFEIDTSSNSYLAPISKILALTSKQLVAQILTPI